MVRRLKLHEELVEILGNNNVYFQPPPSVKLQYPCIVYKRLSGFSRYADDRSYSFRLRYQVTLIDKNPDSEVIKKLAAMKMCAYDRHYTADNLNHDVFDLYY